VAKSDWTAAWDQMEYSEDADGLGIEAARYRYQCRSVTPRTGISTTTWEGWRRLGSA
jgi:hypothetical protein